MFKLQTIQFVRRLQSDHHHTVDVVEQGFLFFLVERGGEQVQYGTGGRDRCCVEHVVSRSRHFSIPLSSLGSVASC